MTMKNIYFIDAPLDAPLPLNNKNLPNSRTIPSQTPAPSSISADTHDPLIASDWQTLLHIVLFLMAVAIIITIGYFSKKIEYAILFALFVSAIAFVFLFAH